MDKATRQQPRNSRTRVVLEVVLVPSQANLRSLRAGETKIW